MSVHKRDRCTRTPSSTFTALRFHCHSLWFVFSIVSPVLVCLSIDVTGALVLSLFSPWFWPVSFLLSLFWVFTCTGVSVHRRDRCTCTLLLLEFPPLFCLVVCLCGVFVGFGELVLFGGLWVCLSADVTGALPPLPPYPCVRIPTRSLVHPLSHFSSLFSLSLRHSLFSLLCPCIYYV